MIHLNMLLKKATNSFSKIDKRIRIHIDILVGIEGKLIPIELKYRTSNLKYKTQLGKDNQFLAQRAYDSGCYGFVKDICRIDKFIQESNNDSKEGHAIFMTNDDKHMKNGEDHSKKVDYKGFWIDDLEHNSDSMEYKSIKIGRVDGCFKRIDLPEFSWIETSNRKWHAFGEDGKFNYCIAKIVG